MFARFDLSSWRRQQSKPERVLAEADRARDELRWTDARDLYAKYLALDPDHAAIWVQFGHSLKESGALDSAERAYRRSLMLAPEVADTHLQLGHLIKRLGNKTGAILAYRKALELDPALSDASAELEAIRGDRPVENKPAAEPAAAPPPFRIEDLDHLQKAFLASEAGADEPWREFQDRILALPPWFEFGLDPLSQSYRRQQIRLWQAISGLSEDYRPERHELTGNLSLLDPIRRPGFYAERNRTAVASAGEHLIALGHILKHSVVSAGDTVLEYGAGFGQIALAFARLGVSVDTVDIDASLCAAVRKQAEFFGVNLNAFHGEFGINPRDGHKYDLILFYASFHHCLDFPNLIPKLRTYLKGDGRIILSGEPVVATDSSIVPYPWGIRLDAANVAVVRFRKWLELGFQEGFLAGQFIRNGFTWQSYPGVISQWANIHVFRPRTDVVALETYQIPGPDASGWHQPQKGGRFTRGLAHLPLDCGANYERVVLRLRNYHPTPIEIGVSCGAFSTTRICRGRETVEIPASAVDSPIRITAETICPVTYGVADSRQLGIFVETLEYASNTLARAAGERASSRDGG